MKSILETCTPRPDILTGTFSPLSFRLGRWNPGQSLPPRKWGEGKPLDSRLRKDDNLRKSC
jgi:hypothetical protein